MSKKEKGVVMGDPMEKNSEKHAKHQTLMHEHALHREARRDRARMRNKNHSRECRRLGFKPVGVAPDMRDTAAYQW